MPWAVTSRRGLEEAMLSSLDAAQSINDGLPRLCIASSGAPLYDATMKHDYTASAPDVLYAVPHEECGRSVKGRLINGEEYLLGRWLRKLWLGMVTAPFSFVVGGWPGHFP